MGFAINANLSHVKAAPPDPPQPTTTIENLTQGWGSLSDSLNPKTGNVDGSKTKWVFDAWNFSLSLVNIVVAGLLIFLAFVNILRIQVDTYAIKKILPTLIIAVILANFSLLICRMVIDFSAVLTKSFVGPSPEQLAKDLRNALGLFHQSVNTGSQGSLGVISLSLFASTGILVAIGGGAIGVIALIVAFLLAVLPALAILFLAFMLFIRTGMVYVLVAASPLAFICMVLPATQSYFKMWWGQFMRWVFMAPVVFIFLKIASSIRDNSGGTNFWAYVIALGMLYLAIQVPFKMGGVIMGAWGGLGKRGALSALKYGGRIADKKFGDATVSMGMKRWSPAGLYQGWKKNADNYYQQHLAESTGTGMEVREGITGLGYQPLGKGQSLWKANPYNARAKMENLDKKAKLTSTEYNIDQYSGMLKNAATQEEAAEILLAGAMAGGLKQKDLDGYLRKYDKKYASSNGQQMSGANHVLVQQAAAYSQKSLVGEQIYDQWTKVGGAGYGGGTAMRATGTAAKERLKLAKIARFQNLNDVAKGEYIEQQCDIVSGIVPGNITEDQAASQRFLESLRKFQSEKLTKILGKATVEKIDKTLKLKPTLTGLFDEGVLGKELKDMEPELAAQIKKKALALDNLPDLSMPLKEKVNIIAQFADKENPSKVDGQLRKFVTDERANIQSRINAAGKGKDSAAEMAASHLDELSKNMDQVEGILSSHQATKKAVDNTK